VSCSLPLSLTENEHFRHFLSVVDSKYVPPARNTITSRLTSLAAELQETIVKQLSSVNSVNTTLDIWSDRRMRAYLGVTCHYITTSAGAFALRSSLLSCTRISGSHTGERIASEIESVFDTYGVKQKVDYIITDNAANMRKAITVAFPQPTSEVEGDDEVHVDVDNPEMWERMDDQDAQEVAHTSLTHAHKERLSCLDHTLHLVVGDGLTESRCISTSLARCCKLASMLHTSSSFKDSFENAFGPNTCISAAVSTRWNSTLRQIKSILALDAKTLTDLLEAKGLKHLTFSTREWCQLREVVELLDPFLEATTLTEGDRVITISYALPSVLALINHLQDVQSQLKYCGPMCFALLASMKKRFEGMLQRVEVPVTRQVADISSLPFGSDIYIISAVLDPKFKLRWIDHEVKLTSSEKEELCQKVKG